MNEQDYHRYIEAFNARDYAMLETFFSDDFVLENAGFRVSGKPAFREFYRFFHAYCRETVSFRGFYPGKGGFVANVVIVFEGLQDLTAEVLAERGYSGMSVVPQGVQVQVEFLILYTLNPHGLIQHIKGAVWVPAVSG
ncbi:nuclear transport factor 2 family protein [Novosphingobium cyanobacteriorum]|uniref:Nuclear transport factor 2 family protein n=1 Tax=Novosphingobium cyanobacteriorum TaxID=3024215 RepID=A0ABT6CCY2_9SPHN|nr:nuclear transport factor 2 family protein [Novosphingobium cyanobacteriorum]MDF8331677.1 nuclear transport factor 2 family protein [Novosphingobium cyanobacteriorum]